ncbi:MAG: diversity-generating retroelement protein Avd [Candidatus Omnitrophica bacterium]|nr:diversity-generating retroelement protein Avd [Candidatus Omnitrophota bacterium]MDD5081718.1 diversity-generating retroelement protein Avd [Candidatus Omnitrophota bacterium]
MTGTPVVEKFKKLICWMLPKVSKFPKDQRYLLVDRIVQLMFDILERMIGVVYAIKGEKRNMLRKINLDIDKLRYFIRIAYEMKYINLKGYDYFTKQIVETGKMIGGWYRYLNN